MISQQTERLGRKLRFIINSSALSVNYISHPRSGGQRYQLNIVRCAALNMSPALAYQSIALKIQREKSNESKRRSREQKRMVCIELSAKNDRLICYKERDASNAGATRMRKFLCIAMRQAERSILTSGRRWKISRNSFHRL